MLKIEVNNNGFTESGAADIGVNFCFNSDSYKEAVSEIAAVLSVMFEKIPRDVFLDGVFSSAFGKDVMKKTEH